MSLRKQIITNIYLNIGMRSTDNAAVLSATAPFLLEENRTLSPIISNRGKCTFFERPRPRSELHLRSLQHVRNNASPEHLYILES